MDEPIYIVAGHPRSGTSAMMRALDSGGMRPIWGRERDARFAKFSDDKYALNPDGNLYEPSKIQLNHLMNPEKSSDFRGRVVKLIVGQLLPLPVADYRVVVIVRDPEEIRLSWERAFNAERDVFRRGRDYWDPSFLKNYWETIAQCQRGLENRRDVWSVCRLEHARLMREPLETISTLLDWPVNAVDAASAIDSKLYRARCQVNE
jgi:hypothetical protein